MALDLSAGGLSHELKRSREVVSEYVNEAYREMLRRFYGPAWKGGPGAPTAVDFENHSYAWISVFLPILASGNPTVKGKSPRQGEAAAFAKAVELAVNRNFALTDIKRTIEQLATDFAFKYCVGFTTPTPVKGMQEREDPPYRPTTKRLSLHDYGWDVLASQHAECRYQFHRVIRDKDSLLEEAEEFPDRGWDTEAIEKMAEDQARRDKRDFQRSALKRNEVEFWDFWVPEVTLGEAIDANGEEFAPDPKEGFEGTIYTVSEEGDMFVRRPRPFWGPRAGPYTFSGYLYIPDEVVPLSPIGATAATAEEFNAVMSASIQAIRRYKRGMAVNSSAQGLEEKIAEFMDLGVFTVDGLEKIEENLKAIEVGGLQPQHLTMLETLRFVLERASGITDAKLGMTSGSTATEASIANMSSGQRMGYMTEKFVQSVVKPIAMKEAWYLANDPRSRTPLMGGEGLFVDPTTGLPIEYPVLEGGPGHGNLLEDLDIEIQPISMRYTSEQLEMEREMQWEQFLLATAPMMPTLPWVDWGLMYSRKAAQLGDPSLARAVDVQKAMAFGMIQMQMSMGMPGVPGGQPMTPTARPPQPRLGIDVGPSQKAAEKPGGFSGNARPQQNKARAKSAARPQPRKGPREAGATASTR
jgi:hypothetical protein